MKNKALIVHEISYSYQNQNIFQSFNLEILKGDFVAVVGSSGCGKTTLLNLLAGYLIPDKGEIWCEADSRMVYQQDGLLPWLSVKDNILLGLREITDEEIKQKQLTELLELVGLEKFADYFPYQLSGGMRQRTEIARALCGNSEILLLDEPFASLDYINRLKLQNELLRILEEFPRTVVLVTHDVEEAVKLADRILLLGEQPTKIVRDFSIDRPRPRELTNYETASIVHEILAEMGLVKKPLEKQPFSAKMET